MAVATPTSYAGTGTIRGGRDLPLPAWAVGAPLNAWIEIPGTNQVVSATNWAGPYGRPTNDASQGWINPWGAVCFLPSGKIYVAPAGGHTDGEDNRDSLVDLMANVPGWVTINPPSLIHRNSGHAGQVDQPYDWDQATPPYNFKPAAVHGYWNLFWCVSKNRVMRVGCTAPSYTGNANFPVTDGFNLDTNKWDPPGTYAYGVPTGQTYPGPTSNVWPTAAAAGVNAIVGQMQDLNGDIWQMYGAQWRYQPATDTYSQALTSNTVTGVVPRGPWAASPELGLVFGLCWGDGQGYDSGISAAKLIGTSLSPITFNSSAARTQFLIDKPEYAGMAYVPSRGTFLLYEGRRTLTADPSDAGRVGRIYEITPNAGSVWDMSFFTYAAGATPPAETINASINNRFAFVPSLKGLVMLPNAYSNIHYMRLA